MIYNWSETYSVGNLILDEQNKQFLSFINELAIPNKEICEELFDELINHLSIHFEGEEDLLHEIDYENTTAHIELHNEFIIELTLFYKKNIQTHNCSGLQDILINWFTKHILIEDMKYKALLLAYE